ncbi:chaperonin 10-like protein [Microdochium trichocladiopsis]|uniref:Chaperonin 10-like protein n=1 Tax=Microdochium trichocladiopsis TaxID=1682393 RepID=A0A9P9BM20_9PEZI|nr:chaperonin 10-like protein [Microdochium trichocladiopsis]KAH7025015.1 chaperonin 10-like protein [Microdochium trichocladiopsis]
MSLPQTFQAALLTGAGAPIEVRDRTPERAGLEPQEVAIKMTATAINPVDWKLRDHPSIFFGDRLPAVLGTDAAGTIHAKGSSVTNLEVGDRVFFQGHLGKYDTSSFQEYARTDAAVVGRTPRNISDEQAAGVSLAGMTAAIGLYHSVGRGLAAPWDDNGGSQAGNGKAIVVLGGSASVGQYVVQLARLSGYSRIVTNASAAHATLLRRLGASTVLDRKTQNSAGDFVQAVGEDIELDCVYDTIGTPETQCLAVEILQKARKVRGGSAGAPSLVVCTHNADDKAVRQGSKLEGGARKVEIKGILAVGPAPEYRNVSEPFYVHVARWLEAGEFVPNSPVVVEGGVHGIEEALRMQKAGVSGAKVVVKF